MKSWPSRSATSGTNSIPGCTSRLSWVTPSTDGGPVAAQPASGGRGDLVERPAHSASVARLAPNCATSGTTRELAAQEAQMGTRRCQFP